MKKINWQHIDRTYWGLFVALIIVAIIALFSASSTLVYSHHSALGPIGQQMVFIVLGVIAAFGIQFIPTNWVRFGGYILLGISTLLVFSTMIPGNPLTVTVNGAARWVRIAGITFQPSELAKLSLIIVIADQLARIRTEEDKKKYFYRTLIISAIVMLPIMASNLSTAVLIGLIIFCLWILARIPWKYTLSVVGIAVLVLGLGYAIVEFGFVRPGHQMHGPFKRATTWVSRIDRHMEHSDESKYVLTDENIQEVYSSVAIARGGSSPFGVLPGNSKERDYLPLAFADYIFAIIVEESGVIGAAFLIFLYLAILFRACNVSSRYSDMPAMLMTMGLALMITCQALISMLVAVGLGPVTGQPLPLISRGGTSVLITSIYFGIMMGVSREQLVLRDRVNETKEESEEDAPIVTLE
ncbi:MAG: FtsW/RodA/SpoVE family cell cycle protein [Paludibacteraceae bacterium]|nr:FtsW/RodA/SpoVE family cell cycle protein [Paludibacteraceae bacterium]MBQ2520499.1 FtsW/RodA/SpoVE family cell cycle protein [Paludibacteraceae bacterium]MBQ5379566.1 FtsW/RodA/SpoVE family cell cycle protein [Paludibacteraceae bacterium]